MKKISTKSRIKKTKVSDYLELPYRIEGKMKYPNRRNNGCDICHKNVPTQFFAGFCKDSLWICSKCYDKITNKQERKHPYHISIYK